jgi:GDP-L-fucose synthase
MNTGPVRILLTGGRGMVGRNIQDHPRARDYEVLAPSRSELNLFDEQAVLDYYARHRPDLVIHAAGTVGGIQANIANPVAFLSDNLKLAENVILGARRSGVPNLLNIGSSCMYPRAAPNPLREEQILTGELEPTNEGYALAKIVAARLCRYIRRETPELQYKTIIPCNLYGRHDKFDPAASHMIPAAILKIAKAVQEGRSEVEIWGDGTARREFMYVGELADFIFYAVPRLGEMPDELNVGLGHDYSINEYYEAISEVLDYGGSFVHDMSKPAGMKQKLVDTSRMKSFGWSTKMSLRDGIQETWNYFRTERER